MQELLAHPMVQVGLAPLVVALLVAAVLWRTRWAWLAVVAGWATAQSLAAGFSFTPLTAGRKVHLLLLLSPLAGLALDALAARAPRWLPGAVAAACGVASAWVFSSLLAQREGLTMAAAALGVAAFVGVTVALMLRLRDDGAATGAAGVAGGLGVGIAALLSASIGYFGAGVAFAAACGAMLLLQFGLRRDTEPGYTGALPLGLGLALSVSATTMLAQLPWYALPLLWVVPLLAAWRRAPHAGALRNRLVVNTALASAGVAPFVLAAWFAARAATSGVS